MAAIDNLEGAVVELQAAVGRVEVKIDELEQGGANEVRVQAAADAVAAEAARLDAAIAPPSA